MSSLSVLRDAVVCLLHTHRQSFCCVVIVPQEVLQGLHSWNRIANGHQQTLSSAKESIANPCAVADGNAQASRQFLHARESKSNEEEKHPVIMKMTFFAEMIEQKTVAVRRVFNGPFDGFFCAWDHAMFRKVFEDLFHLRW